MITNIANELGLLGGGSFAATSILSLISNSMNNKHLETITSLKALSENYKYSLKDVENARKIKFSFTRRLIVLSLFILFPILLYLVAKHNYYVTIPYQYAHSFLGFAWSGYKFKTVKGFIFMMRPMSDILSMVTGFYFGSKFKN